MINSLKNLGNIYIYIYIYIRKIYIFIYLHNIYVYLILRKIVSDLKKSYTLTLLHVKRKRL